MVNRPDKAFENPFPQFWSIAGPPPMGHGGSAPDSVAWWGAYGWSMATCGWWITANLNKGDTPMPTREEVASYLDWLGPREAVEKFIDRMMEMIAVLWSPPFRGDRKQAEAEGEGLFGPEPEVEPEPEPEGPGRRFRAVPVREVETTEVKRRWAVRPVAELHTSGDRALFFPAVGDGPETPERRTSRQDARPVPDSRDEEEGTLF